MKISNQNLKAILCVICVVVSLCLVVVFFNKGDYTQYLNKEEYPNCMAVDDYGESGNVEGIIRKTKTKTQDYEDMYGLFFETYYMKDNETANLKLDKLLKDENQLDSNAVITPMNKKVIKVLNNDRVIYYIHDNQTVYRASGKQQFMERNQKWFDLLKIDYKVEL